MTYYSMNRYRKQQPSLPVWIGGRWLTVGARTFLRDAESTVEVTGDIGTFNNGDLVVVQLVGIEAEKWICAAGKCVQSCDKETIPKPERAADFAAFVRAVRGFFVEQGLTEIFTPSLVICPGLEPSLEPFAIQVTKGRETRQVYLPTSPEIHLKKALARGWTDIFEIKNCFRRGEFSVHHENEFLMLEWYRSFADLEAILADLSGLLLHLRPFMSTRPELRRTTFAELFRRHLNFALSPTTEREELANLCRSRNMHFTTEDSFNDLFHRLLIEHIEPQFKKMGAVIVRDFPPSQAALARLTKEGWADRFEFYWNGLEIANAFFEVTDADEQRRRWQAEADERKHLGTTPLPMDEGLLVALQTGIPPTGGIALGVERLYMACRGVENIRELRLFATEELFTHLR